MNTIFNIMKKHRTYSITYQSFKFALAATCFFLSNNTLANMEPHKREDARDRFLAGLAKRVNWMSLAEQRDQEFAQALAEIEAEESEEEDTSGGEEGIEQSFGPIYFSGSSIRRKEPTGARIPLAPITSAVTAGQRPSHSFIPIETSNGQLDLLKKAAQFPGPKRDPFKKPEQPIQEPKRSWAKPVALAAGASGLSALLYNYFVQAKEKRARPS